MPDSSSSTTAKGNNELAALVSLGEKQKALEEQIAKLESELKAKKKQLADVRDKELPETMEQIGLNSFELADGSKIELKVTVRANIPKAKQAEAIAYLENRGAGGLVRRMFNISFGRDDEAWAKKFQRDLDQRKRELDVQRSDTVHHKTLSSWVQNQLEEGEEVDMELLGAFRQKASKITHAKKQDF